VVQERQPPDPEIERRKQEKARLQREVEELEAQVSRCIDEVVKEQRRGPEDSLRPPERDSLK
jgi:type II secretory pathway component PulM